MRDYGDVMASGALELVGFVEEILPVLAGADAGVLLTDATVARAGCSNAIMEYMACGLPVLCTDGGGNPELVESGRTGLVIPAGSLGDLLEGLVLLGDDGKLGDRLGEVGARRLLANYSPAAMAGRSVRFMKTSSIATLIGGETMTLKHPRCMWQEQVDAPGPPRERVQKVLHVARDVSKQLEAMAGVER